MCTNERSQGWPGGSIAVYGNETLRTITGIESLNRLGRDSGGNGTMYYSQSEKQNKDDAFAGILETEQKKTEEPKDISLRSVTYTRSGMASAVYVMMRDYTYQQ